MRTEITKKGFRGIVWATLISGLIVTMICSTLFLINNVEVWQANTFLIAFWTIGLIAVGFGMGLANSRVWKIKDYD